MTLGSLLNRGRTSPRPYVALVGGPYVALVGVAMSLLFGARCDESRETTAVSGVYSPVNGLTLSTPNGAEVSIPPGASNKEMDVVIASPPPTRSPRPGSNVAIVGEGVSVEPADPGLSTPATITVPITPTAIPAGYTESDVVVVYDSGAGFSIIPSVRPSRGGAVIAESVTFGTFYPVIAFVDRSDAGADDPVGQPPPCTLTEPFGAPVLIAGLDTIENEIVRSMSADEKTVYFEVNTATQKADIRYVTRASPISAFTFADILAGVSTTASELGPSISSDGLSMVFSRSFTGSSDWNVYLATRSDVSQDFPGGTLIYDGQEQATGPFIVPSGNIYYSTYDSAPIAFLEKNGSSYSAPVPLTELGNGVYPVLDSSELTIYFSVTPPNSSTWQIYVATRESTTDPFGMPIEVPNVNSNASEFPSHISADGCRLYLTSNRSGRSDFDGYVSSRPFVP